MALCKQDIIKNLKYSLKKDLKSLMKPAWYRSESKETEDLDNLYLTNIGSYMGKKHINFYENIISKI